MGNSSAVILLLDYSKTFAPYSMQDAAALSEVSKAIMGMVKDGSLSQPTKILWAAFGDNGLRPVEPCGPAKVFVQRLTGGNSTSADSAPRTPAQRLTSFNDLDSWLSVCTEVIQAASKMTQEFTDISGALTLASNAADDVSDGRIIVVFSDFKEDLPPGRQAGSVLSLGKTKVLLIWRPGLDDQMQPAMVSARVDDWKKRLEEAGASRVCSKVAAGVTEGDISKCLGK